MHDALPADELPKEIAFAHAVLAHAAAASRDHALHAEHHRQARSLASGLYDGDRRVFEATFRAVPAPP